MKANLNYVNVATSTDLVEILKEAINRNKSYFLIINSWDKPSDWFNDELKRHSDMHGDDLYVIDIFDVPNPLEIIRSCIKEHKETMSTSCLSSYESLPMLVVLHKAFPRVVTYNGSIAAELGI